MKLKLNVPIVRENSNGFEKYKIDGTLEIEFDEEPDAEKVNNLLAIIDAQFSLLADEGKIRDLISENKGRLANVREELRLAHAQLNRVSKFLKGIGVNPREHLLRFDENFKLRSAEFDREGEGNEDEGEFDEESEDD